ncbi:MAG: HD domain-containing protein [Planctomycetota bacterium]|nr:HD domain-containing protein [Planctomycetota bacterium]
MDRLPELDSLHSRTQLIRIPDQLDVPLTPRVKRLVDSEPFRRLASISQLGLVQLVYPGATHSRFEHSLGVYRNTLLFLEHLLSDPHFPADVTDQDLKCLVVASLLHDLGHWPFCHPIEDMKLDGLPKHEAFVQRWIMDGEIAELLSSDWGISGEQVLQLLSKEGGGDAQALLRSVLSGPIDVDKLDYLYRDSLHAGIPYGRNFDRQRLMSSLCVDTNGKSIALNEKAKTAAEMMVFARYVMFSEVYWHHAVRSATAMFQRAFFEMHRRGGDWESWFLQDEPDLIRTFQSLAPSAGVEELLAGLFGSRRRLYKRLAQFSVFDGEAIYSKIARRPFAWLVRCGQCLAELLANATGQPVSATDVLIDAPPMGLEVEFKVNVRIDGGDRPLGDISPVVQTLATRQFDDYVKRVRIFVHPRLTKVRDLELATIHDLLERAIQKT